MNKGFYSWGHAFANFLAGYYIQGLFTQVSQSREQQPVVLEQLQKMTGVRASVYNLLSLHHLLQMTLNHSNSSAEFEDGIDITCQRCHFELGYSSTKFIQAKNNNNKRASVYKVNDI